MPTGERKSVKKLARDIAAGVDFLSLGECFPYLRWLDLDGVEKRITKLHVEFYAYLKDQVEQRRCRLLNGEDDDSSHFLRVLLSLVDSKDENGLTLKNTKGALMVSSKRISSFSGFSRSQHMHRDVHSYAVQATYIDLPSLNDSIH